MKDKFAFSLVELAVSLTVISLIAGIILAGKNLYNQSNLRSVIKEIQTINNSITIFKDKFGYLPGDYPAPPSYWNAVAGDGNGSVSTIIEISNVWHHLYAAGLIIMPFSKYNSGTNYNLYKSNYASLAVYDFRLQQIFNFNLNAIEMGSIKDYGASNSLFRPKDIYYIDIKIDDGIANYGLLLGSDGVDTSTGNCSARYSNNSTSIINYNLNINSVSCRLSYIGNPLYNG